MGEVVFGREAELTEARRFIDGIPRGSASLLFEGSAGIGKTTVWQASLGEATGRGARVLSSRPGPSEARLSYAGLVDLLGTVQRDAFDQIPPPQRKALDTAMLRLEAEPRFTDQRSIATGFLTLLRILARATPVIIAVDDIQWLDVPTWHVLEFAMRRLETEPVGLLAAVRVEAEAGSRIDFRALPKDRLREIRLRPLTLAALHEVLRSKLGHAFTRPWLVRIERTSGGNPFFALELARAILESGEPVPPSGSLAVPEDLAELLTSRIRRLPARAQDALLVASAMSQPTADMIDADAIADAEAAGLVRTEPGGRVVFAHPLLASAVYASATVSRRREIHRGLASRVRDAEARARHLALASDGSNEEVARALVSAARTARERGAPDAAIELIQLACERTAKDDRDALFIRRLDLARTLSTAGDPGRARRLLLELIGEARPGPLRARVMLLLSFLTDWTEGSESATRLCEGALIEAGADDALRAEIHASASRMSDHDPERKSYHARAALELVARGADPRLHAYALLAFAEAEFYVGHGILADVFEQAAALESAAPLEPIDPIERLSHTIHLYSDVSPSSRLLAILRLYADELDAARTAFERDRRGSLEHGDEAQLARTLGRLATLELRAGRHELAEGHLRELDAVVQRTGQQIARHRRLLLRSQLDAIAGRIELARAAGDEGLAIANAAAWAWETSESRAMLGFVELTSGDLAAARAHLDIADGLFRGIGLGDPGFIRYQPDHIEVLVALGDLAAAEAAYERFVAQARALSRPSALATAARCRALLLAGRGDLDGALEAVTEAFAHHRRVTIPFELGRTLLVKGQIHRRRKEKVLAREALVESVGVFERLGSPPWADRARAEMTRIGLVKRDPAELTSTEEQIASLAATGLTNRAIAERAFLSPKTVEANLAHVYQKLGIHSRAELGRAIAHRERATAK